MAVPLLMTLAICFMAANSLLTRAGVADGTDPLAFALIRVVAGAVVLCTLAARQGVPLGGGRRWGAAAALAAYLVAFSLAYRTLDAGLGALVLFGAVHVGLLGLAFARGEASGPVRLAGMAVALAGLTWLLLPGGAPRAGPWDAALMVVAGLSWAAYTAAGRTEPRPLAGSAGNFVIATGLVAATAPLWWIAGGSGLPQVTPLGAGLATLSGGIASGLGYVILFRVLPRMRIATAGVAQLAVPVVAMAGGTMLLGEVLTPRALAAGAVVLAGIALATLGGPGKPARDAREPRGG